MPPEERELHAPEVGRHRQGQRRRRRFWAQDLVGIGAILAICYYAELVLAVLLVSVLLAFILTPLVDVLMRVKLPRGVASLVALLIFLTAIVGVIYLSYNQASNFLAELPKYTEKIHDELNRFRQKAESLQALNPATEEKGVLRVHPTSTWTESLTRGFGSVSEAILAVSFVPFMVYFMLTWHQHVRSATVMLFSLENRHTAYVTLGLISAMIRSFMVGNLLIGLFMGGVSTLVFGILHLPFFYFAGMASGFLSLVPYMGVLLALAPPLFLGLGHLESGDLLGIVVTVVGLHVLSLNVLYPKILGNRMQLNPLAVSMSLLVWAWLWGAVGLLLAIPITAAMKIIFDHVESLQPLGAWLGE